MRPGNRNVHWFAACNAWVQPEKNVSDGRPLPPAEMTPGLGLMRYPVTLSGKVRLLLAVEPGAVLLPPGKALQSRVVNATSRLDPRILSAWCQSTATYRL